MSSYQYRIPHVKDKTTVLSLTWESPYLGKKVFILRQGPERLHIYHDMAICQLRRPAMRRSNPGERMQGLALPVGTPILRRNVHVWPRENTHTHHESNTHIPFVPCQSALPFLRYGYLKIWPWKSKFTITAGVKGQYGKLNFWSTRPKSDVPYMFYTKFYLDKPNFYSLSSKWTRIGKH